MFEEDQAAGVTKSTEVNGSLGETDKPTDEGVKENLLERSFGHLDDAEERQPRKTNRDADGKTIVRDGKTIVREGKTFAR